MPEIIQDKKVFSLLEVARSIQKTLTERYASSFWIKADMNKMNIYPQSGHCFPELLEKKDGRVIAEIRAVLWRDDFNRINKEFMDVLHEPLKDGITILFAARIQFDPVYGLNLRITEIDPWYSLGELEKEKQLSILRLRSEGVFDLNRNLPFPLLPKRIAIISVESSKGYSDFMKIMNNNNWDYSFFHMLFPAFLQGDKAVGSILYQLKRIKKVIDHFDVVAIIRGGGGDIGLTCYNNFELARAIATYPIPVLTGIGHSTNETVSELVAFKNAITPTELADFLLQHYHEFSVPLHEAENKLVERTTRLIREENSALIALARLLRSVTRSTLINNNQQVEYARRTLLQNSLANVTGSTSRLSQTLSRIFASVNMSILRHKHALGDQQKILSDKSKNIVALQLREIANTEKMVNILSPRQVMKRGYSITTINGRLVSSVAELRKGDKIITAVADGEIHSEVTTTK
jgi:exodeoxyribonuclease VII large subunit